MKKIIISIIILIPFSILGLFVAWIFEGQIRGHYYCHQLGNNNIGFCGGVNTFTHEMSSSEIESLYWHSLENITDKFDVQPKIYRYKDQIDWPRLKAIWQLKNKYLVVGVAMNNDNDSIWWASEAGIYDSSKDTEAIDIQECTDNYKLPLRK